MGKFKLLAPYNKLSDMISHMAVMANTYVSSWEH